VAVVLLIHAPDDRLVQDAVRRHHLDLPLDVTTAAVGADAVSGFLAGRLDFKPTPPRFQRQDVRMEGARITQVSDLPAAYLRYELPRGRVGLFIVDDPHRRFETPGRDVQVGPATVRVVSARGYNVATWRQDEIVYSLVSDLGEDDLFQLVRAAQAR
jgi:anti-sigma factor RsiW